MPRSHMQALVAVISIALLLPRASGAPREEELSDVLQDRMPYGREEGSKMLLVRLVSELLGGEEAAPGPGRRDVMPGRRWNSPRDRKAGCKNFFWKTFTLC
ncbi:somatostatin-1-like [Pristis pectinata]|uniref:somatostatin-1-like n=1 Tax=Pristis pectinata TaxID=685728 RepID=UPI00223E5892|nr:somatostatin-1-like [Pristis pectinata]